MRCVECFLPVNERRTRLRPYANTGDDVGVQINEFLRFFETKRELYVSEVEAIFNDVKEARCE